MPKTAVVYARIDAELKEKAEAVLKQLGLSASSAISMLYAQIARSKGLPLDLRLVEPPFFEGDMSKEELKAKLEDGFKAIEEGKVYTQEEVETILKEEFGI